MRKKVLLIAVVTLFAFTAKAQIVVTSTQASSYTEPAPPTPKWERPTGFLFRGEWEYDILQAISFIPQLDVGYQISPMFSLSAGLSYRNIDYHSFVPLYMGTRIHLPTGRVQPFLNLKIGYPLYSKPVYEKVSGFLFAGDIGLSIGYFNMSVSVTNYGMTYIGPNYSYGESWRDTFVGFRVGFDLIVKK